MIGTEGPLSWTSFRPLVGRPPRLAGFDLSRCLIEYRRAPVPSGVTLDMLDGGKVSQSEPLPVLASRNRAAQELTLSLTIATEQDARLPERLLSLCRDEPQELLLWDVVEDVWRIPASVRTAWPLSREVATPPPDQPAGEICRPNSTNTTLTLVSGTPAAGEIAISGSLATTDDLSAEVGAVLAVRYFPKRWVAGVSLASVFDSRNNLTVELTLAEWLP